MSDAHLPSVVRMVGGPDVKGSWWGTKKGVDIYRILEWLELHPDVLPTRLVSGKVTFLHRRIWTEFLSIAAAREGWQMHALSQEAKNLLLRLDIEGEVKAESASQGKVARELESRLLAYGEEIHTAHGFHAKVLMSWPRCPKIREMRFRPVDPEAARSLIGKILDRLNESHEGEGTLPWRQK